MSLTIPYTFTGGAGNKAKASEVNANFQAIKNKFTEGAGGIGNSDIATLAGIVGTKISNTIGSRIPSDRLEPNAVDKDALKDDPTAGSPNAAVNSADHIKNGIITNEKLVNGTVLPAKAKILYYAKSIETLFNLTGPHLINAGATVLSTYENSSAIAGRKKDDVIPLGVFIEQSLPGPPSTSFTVEARVVTTTNDNVVYFMLHNYGASSVVVIGSTLFFYYWART